MRLGDDWVVRATTCSQGHQSHIHLIASLVSSLAPAESFQIFPNSVYQSVLSFVIVAEMKLSFQLATIALGLCVTAAGFMYFFCDTNLYRGLWEDRPEERALDNDRQQRNRRRGRGIGTDSPINENFTANSPLRQRPKPQEHDEPL